MIDSLLHSTAGNGDIFSTLSNAADLFGIGSSGSAKRADAHQFRVNWQNQYEMAQNGIRWKADDARAAGIHPLFALGANISAGNPVMVGGSAPAPSKTDFLRNMGQDVSRAASAGLSEEERNVNRIMNALQLEKAGLENDLLRSQIARSNGQLGPGLPGANRLIPGQGNSKIDILPSETVHHNSGTPYEEAAGAVPATQTFLNRDGSVTVWPSKAAKQSTEDSLYEYEHMYRNRVLPRLSGPFYDYVYKPVSDGRDWVKSRYNRPYYKW